MHLALEIASPLGPLTLVEHNGALVAATTHAVNYRDLVYQSSPLLAAAAQQFAAYFAGSRRHFDLPLAPVGTPFQQQVWQALRDIPYGETRSYGDIARAVGRPQAFRAVGGANHHNPLLIINPCHRVLGADGSLTGFGAGGIENKRLLLQLEGAQLREKAQKNI